MAYTVGMGPVTLVLVVLLLSVLWLSSVVVVVVVVVVVGLVVTMHGRCTGREGDVSSPPHR